MQAFQHLYLASNCGAWWGLRGKVGVEAGSLHAPPSMLSDGLRRSYLGCDMTRRWRVCGGRSQALVGHPWAIAALPKPCHVAKLCSMSRCAAAWRLLAHEQLTRATAGIPNVLLHHHLLARTMR